MKRHLIIYQMHKNNQIKSEYIRGRPFDILGGGGGGGGGGGAGLFSKKNSCLWF